MPGGCPADPHPGTQPKAGRLVTVTIVVAVLLVVSVAFALWPRRW